MTTKKADSSAHGGAREGAGRPPVDGVPLIRRSYAVTPEQATYAEARGEGNASAGLRAVLRDAMERGDE